jgi:hypothetical protein
MAPPGAMALTFAAFTTKEAAQGEPFLFGNEGGAVGILRIPGIGGLDLNLVGVAAIPAFVIITGIDHSLYPRQMLILLVNLSLHQGNPPLFS